MLKLTSVRTAPDMWSAMRVWLRTPMLKNVQRPLCLLCSDAAFNCPDRVRKRACHGLTGHLELNTPGSNRGNASASRPVRIATRRRRAAQLPLGRTPESKVSNSTRWELRACTAQRGALNLLGLSRTQAAHQDCTARKGLKPRPVLLLRLRASAAKTSPTSNAQAHRLSII